MEVNKVTITPEEVFVLGKVLNAKYIDYAYAAAVKEIGMGYDIFEKGALNRLVSAGLLEEDFSGNIIPKEETINVFTPVFFGQLETTLDICSIGETVRLDTYKFHFFDDQITRVVDNNGVLEAGNIGIEELNSIIKNVFGNIDEIDGEAPSSFDKGKVSRFVAVKSNHLTEKTVVVTFMEMDNRMYREDGKGKICYLKAEDFMNEILTVLKGMM